MTQEDKELLLKDLCTRLPYGIKVLNMAEEVNEVCELDSIMTSRKHKDKIFVSLTLPDDSVMTGIEMVKPYLRPISSMTEEESKEYRMFIDYSYNDFTSESTPCVYIDKINDYLDWLIIHHFDYRGLIPMGIALEAPKDMY